MQPTPFWTRIAPFLLLIVSTPLFAEPADNAALMTLADQYFDTVYLPENPTIATQIGIHTFDNQLEDFSKKGIKHHINTLETFEKRISAIDLNRLDEQTQGDAELLLNQIRSELLTLKTIKPWEKNPDFYSSGITTAAFVIIERPYASTDERLRALIARENKMPDFLLTAHSNLKNPPKIFTEIALEQLPGLIHFFQNDVPAAFAGDQNVELKKQFEKSNATVIQALQEYQTWLKVKVLPRSNGDFRIGKDTFQKKLAYDEMVELPLDQLLVIGQANLAANQQAFKQIANEIDPHKTPNEILSQTAVNHPAPDQVLATFGATFDTLMHFIQDKKIISIPSDVHPIMEETPPFLRAITFASMDTPGPFETHAKEAYFNVTLPNPTWTEAEVNSYMGFFTYPDINVTSIHETYPGHYIQFLWMQKIDDRVRKILGASTNSEGWAHYCEQMMLDEGFGAIHTAGSNVPDAKLLRLAQLKEALLRNARFIVGIKLHTGQMTFNQAVDFFVKEGYQSPIAALMETKRGTSNPTYLYYTLGKLQILKLRADLEAKQGKAFNLQQFHDDFMRQGYPPIKIVRKALMHDDSPTL